MYIKCGFPLWLVALGSQHHFAKEWCPCNLSRNYEGCKMHERWFHAQKKSTPQASQLTTKMNIGSVAHITSGPKKGLKKKWDKNPPRDKRTMAKKKLWDVVKVWCFNCKKLHHFTKDCEKVSQDSSQIYRFHGFIPNLCEISYFMGLYCLNMKVLCTTFVCKQHE